MLNHEGHPPVVILSDSEESGLLRERTLHSLLARLLLTSRYAHCARMHKMNWYSQPDCTIINTWNQSFSQMQSR